MLLGLQPTRSSKVKKNLGSSFSLKSQLYGISTLFPNAMTAEAAYKGPAAGGSVSGVLTQVTGEGPGRPQTGTLSGSDALSRARKATKGPSRPF